MLEYSVSKFILLIAMLLVVLVPSIYYFAADFFGSPVVIVNLLFFLIAVFILIAVMRPVRSISAFSFLLISLCLIYFLYAIASLGSGYPALLMSIPLLLLLVSEFTKSRFFLFTQRYSYSVLLIGMFLVLIQLSDLVGGGRLNGFFLSSSAFSVWLFLFLFLIVLILDLNKAVATVFLTFLLVVIYLTGTRSVFIISLLLVSTYFLSSARYSLFWIVSNFKVTFLVLFSMPFFYIFLYTLMDFSALLSLFDNRNFQSEHDYSFLTRVGFYEFSWDKIRSGGVWEYIFGNGIGSLDLSFSGFYAENYQAHNDFLLIFHDVGLLGLLVFSLTTAYVGSRNLETFLFTIFFYSCSLHNMMASMYVVVYFCLILVFMQAKSVGLLNK